MYFIEHLCDMSQRENHLNFVWMMQKDILRVVDAVAPSDGSGAANVKVVRRVSRQGSDWLKQLGRADNHYRCSMDFNRSQFSCPRLFSK